MDTAYYGLRGENGHRRKACHSPTILSDGRLQPAAGAARYTLANLLLSKRPMTERGLVRSLLCIYAACGGGLVFAMFVVILWINAPQSLSQRQPGWRRPVIA